MRILTRYLLRAHIGPFLFALSMLTGLLLVNTVARRFEELAGKGLELGVILEVFLLSVPHIIALTMPMAVLVAVLYAFSQLASDNEVTALKASGVNLARLLLPLVGAGVLLTLTMIWFNDQVLPDTNHRLKNLLTDIARKSPTIQLEEQTVNEIRFGDYTNRYYLQAGEIETATNRLTDVVIYDLSQPGIDRTLYADSGQMAFNRDQTDLFLTLYDGYMVTLDRQQPESFQRMYFDRQLIRMAGVGNQLQRSEAGYRGDREMSVGMLAAEIQTRREELDSVRARAAEVARRTLDETLQGRVRAGIDVPAGIEVPAGFDEPRFEDEPTPPGLVPGAADFASQGVATELGMLETQASLARGRLNEFLVEYHKKFSIPFACIVFVLIGAPLAVRFPRGGVGMVIAASLGIFTIYYIGLRAGEELGDRGHMVPFWAMWLTNAVALAFGLWGMTRVGKEISTARGGGWDDLWHSLRGRITRPFTFAARRARG